MRQACDPAIAEHGNAAERAPDALGAPLVHVGPEAGQEEDERRDGREERSRSRAAAGPRMARRRAAAPLEPVALAIAKPMLLRITLPSGVVEAAREQGKRWRRPRPRTGR